MSRRKFICVFCGEEHPAATVRCPETGQMLDRVHRMQGAVLEGKYQVGRVIAEGGMGVIYEGEHVKIGRKVAIKFLLHGTSQSPTVLERFENEARIAASMGHRNIVDVLDMGATSNNVPFIVMEFLEGSDLSALLEAAVRLPQPWAVDIAIQILSALRGVHARGIVHRDLKPDNVFLKNEPDGSMTVKILDFGVSRLKRHDAKNTSLTRTGAVFGTPRYMAPEQARGVKDIDHRADLYSVGVLLYRMLTGAFPFDAPNYNTLIIDITTRDPIHVGKHGVALPAGLEAVVMWSLARGREERFADADEFVEALLPYRDAEVGPEGKLSSVPPPSGARGVLWGESTPSSLESLSLPSKEPSGVSQEAVTVRPEDGIDLREVPANGDEQGSGSDAGIASQDDVRGDRSDPAGPPVVARPSRSKSRRSIGILVAGLAILSLVGLAALLLHKALSIEARMAAIAGETSRGGDDDVAARGAADDGGRASGGDTVYLVEIEGMPEGAEVYVDGVLHPERPVIVPAGSETRRIRIVADGHRVWENEVAILDDLDLRVDLELDGPQGSDVGSGEADGDVATGTIEKKRQDPAGEKKTVAPDPDGGEKPGKVIDKTYPGLP